MRRRDVLVGAGALLGGCTAPARMPLGAPEDAASASDWPMVGHDLANTGFNPTASGPTGSEVRFTRRGVEGRWTLPGPAIVEGTMYIGSRPYVYAIGLDGSLEWRTRIDANLHHFSPSVSGSSVVLASRTAAGHISSGEGRLFRLDRASGEIRWQDDTPISSDPILLGDRLLHLTSTEAGSALIVRRLDNGAVERRSSIGEGGVVATTPPAVGDGRTVVSGAPRTSSRDRSIVSAFAADGTPDWSTPVQGTISHGPVLGTDAVFVGTDAGSLVRLDPTAGTVDWTLPVGGSITARPALAEGTCYAITRRPDGPAIVAIDADAGEIRWAEASPGVSSGVAVGTDAVFATGSRIVALTRDGGRPIWGDSLSRISDNGGAWSPPAVVADIVCAGACLKRPESNYQYDNELFFFR